MWRWFVRYNKTKIVVRPKHSFKKCSLQKERLILQDTAMKKILVLLQVIRLQFARNPSVHGIIAPAATTTKSCCKTPRPPSQPPQTTSNTTNKQKNPPALQPPQHPSCNHERQKAANATANPTSNWGPRINPWGATIGLHKYTTILTLVKTILELSLSKQYYLFPTISLNILYGGLANFIIELFFIKILLYINGHLFYIKKNCRLLFDKK